jgi:hypothetical protein
MEINMPAFSASRVVRAIALAATFVVAPSVRAQGVSYDISTTATGMDPRGGGASAMTMMAGHGQFVNGISRLDFTQSMARGGMMGAGTYMISNTAKGTTTSVDPAKKEYMVIDLADLAKTSAALQQSMGGMMKTEITNVKVGLEDLGAGESMEGYSTVKYRLTESYTMRMSIMGHTTETSDESSTDLWIAPQLDAIMNPGARPSGTADAGMMAPLTNEIAKVYAKVRKGVVLKSVRTSQTVSNGKTRPTTMTMIISNVKHAPISPSVFEVPAGYTKVASLSDALSPMNGIADSLKAARARAHKP